MIRDNYSFVLKRGGKATKDVGFVKNLIKTHFLYRSRSYLQCALNYLAISSLKVGRVRPGTLMEAQ